ncbi:amino acid adenylation domain-containing protein [Streptomyces sp. NBC_01619]|uniref:non-ribosomal peptide synthetase n=1 Tax=Streptomyces sp. NBC_01619 TaxID=2975901 RepID=UPI00224ED449|nr:non-ribosomal peptide synthetase [Streptomyces sp. NBC_01619]MCX4515983.1 amino acid adenylation domain-containing protein [Streptomyces sp. NBC_01619]
METPLVSRIQNPTSLRVKCMNPQLFTASDGPEHATRGGTSLIALLPAVERLAAREVAAAALRTVHETTVQVVSCHGSEDFCDQFLGDMRSGNIAGALAITEHSSGSNPRDISSVAVTEGDAWRMNGHKVCVTGAEQAGVFIVLARFTVDDDHHAPTVVAVPADAEGVQVSPALAMLGLKSTPISDVMFTDVRVEPWQVLGTVGGGFDVIGDALGLGRTCAAAIALAVMKRSAQLMFRYASNRTVATGRLFDNPQVNRRMSRIASDIAIVESLLQKVCVTGCSTPEEITMILKSVSSEWSFTASDDALQTLGWRGYAEVSGLPALMRDSRFLRIGEGPTEALITEVGARLAAGSESIYEWINTQDAVATSVELHGLVEQFKHTGDFYELGRLGCAAVLEAAISHEEAKNAPSISRLRDEAVASLRSPPEGRSVHEELPTYAEGVGTLDDFLATRRCTDDAFLSPRYGHKEKVLPLVGARRPGWHRTVHGMVQEQIDRSPEAIAVVSQEYALTYAELDEHASHMVSRLVQAGVRPGDVVGILLRKQSADLPISSLAVLRAGAVLLVLNPSHPASRIAEAAQDARISCIVFAADTSHVLPPDVPSIDAGVTVPFTAPPPAVNTNGDAAAYLNFTSGSTGRPKAVAVSHASFANQLRWRRDEFGIGSHDAVLLSAAPGFDIFMWEVFGPLMAGAQIVLCDPEMEEWDPRAIADSLVRDGVTAVQVVPSQLEVLMEMPELATCAKLRHVFCGGEPLPMSLARRFHEIRPNARMVNLYGPTEAAIDATFWPFDPAEQSNWAPIGRPVDNTHHYVVDEEGALVPDGHEGELWIGGAGVAIGYVTDAGLTDRRFRRDWRVSDSAARIYRTGDRVRRRSDGSLEFLGRFCRQLKIRGMRIEPAEVERVLCSHPSVLQAVVNAQERRPGEKCMVAYVAVGSSHEHPASEAILATAREHLPAGMVPNVVIVLDSFPLSTNGKVDVDRLPPARFGSDRPAPGESELDHRAADLASVWQEVLGYPVPGPSADFFEIGGHSLAALRVSLRVQESSGVRLEMRDFMQNSTLSSLADLIHRREQSTHASDQDFDPTPADRSGPVPLAPAQAALWYHQEAVPESAAYNVTDAVRICGSLDSELLRTAFDQVAGRHEALRTVFPAESGKPSQVVRPAGLVSFEESNLSHVDSAIREDAAREYIRNFAIRPFDLKSETPLRVCLVTVNADEAYLAWTVHHIAADGWSTAKILPDELSAAYRAVGKAEDRPALEIQPADYSGWTASRLTEERCAECAAYWSENLQDAPPEVTLPRDFPRPQHPIFTGARVPIAVPAETRKLMQSFARRCKASPYHVLLTVFATSLAASGRDRDVVVGGVTAGRDHASVEKVIGNFAAMLPFRCDLRDNPTCHDAVVKVRDTVKSALRHSDLPFTDIVNTISPPRESNRNPLFQAALALYDGEFNELSLPNATIEAVEIDPGTARFDLLASLKDDGCKLDGFLEYDTELFAHATAVDMVRQFESLLERFVENEECRLERLVNIQEESQTDPTEAGAPTAAQHRIWMIGKLDPENAAALSSQRYYELNGDVDTELLEQALQRLMRRHIALRSQYDDDGGGHIARVITEPSKIQMHDLRSCPEASKETLFRQLLDKDAREPLDISSHPPFRPMVIRLEDDRLVLGMNCHHIASDWWSDAAVNCDLAGIYRTLSKHKEMSK